AASPEVNETRRESTSASFDSDRIRAVMALLNLWKNNKEDILKFTIEQVVSSAGDGSLRDDSSCCSEFRSFLRVAPSESLYRYARHCLETSFNKGGLVLQDVINELGR